MGIHYKGSSYRHGMSEEDMLYVLKYPISQQEFVDRNGRKAIKFKGPVHAQTNRIAEVFVTFDGEDFHIFHAMETGERS